MTALAPTHGSQFETAQGTVFRSEPGNEAGKVLHGVELDIASPRTSLYESTHDRHTQETSSSHEVKSL